MRSRRIGIPALIAAALPGACADGSPGRAITGEPTCAACAIERYLLATIQDSTFEGGALSDAASVFVTEDTTFFVLSGSGLSPAEVFVADRHGGIITRVGQSGEGPGEYSQPQFVMESSSAYLVLDTRLNRVTRLSKSGLELLGTRRVPDVISVTGSNPVAFDDGSFALEAQVALDGSNEGPVHLFSSEGDVIRSFGLGDTTRADRVLTPGGPRLASEGGIWLAEYERYRIEKWDREGNLVDVIERDVEWFPWPAPEPAAGQRFATLGAIHEDGQGRLWVHLTIRRRIERQRPDGTTRLAVDTDPAQSETIIEVLDPAQRTVVASTRIEGWRAYAIAGGFYQLEYDTSPAGQPLIHVWAYRMKTTS